MFSNPHMLMAGGAIMLLGLLIAITVPLLAQAAGLAPRTAFLFPYLLAAFALYIGSAVTRAIRKPMPMPRASGRKARYSGACCARWHLGQWTGGCRRPHPCFSGAACPFPWTLDVFDMSTERQVFERDIPSALPEAKKHQRAVAAPAPLLQTFFSAGRCSDRCHDVSAACYLVVLKWRGGDARVVTYMPWDEWIPFRPAWVWIYLIPYIIGPAALGVFKRRDIPVVFEPRWPWWRCPY